MKAMKIFEWVLMITFATLFIGSAIYMVFSPEANISPIADRIISIIIYIFKIIGYVILGTIFVGIIGLIIWFLFIRETEVSTTTAITPGTPAPNRWTEFTSKLYESLESFFKSLASAIKWMAKEAKILFILIVLGLSLWMILEFSPGLAKKWAGAKPPKGVEWSTKQYLQANGWWPDNKKTVWFWQDSKPKVAKKEPLSIWDYFDNVSQRNYMIKKQAIDSGLYDKPSASNAIDQNTSLSSGSGASINQSGQKVDVDALLQNSTTTKAIEAHPQTNTANVGTTNWNQGIQVQTSDQVDVDALLQNSTITKSIND